MNNSDDMAIRFTGMPLEMDGNSISIIPEDARVVSMQMHSVEFAVYRIAEDGVLMRTETTRASQAS